MKPQPRYGSHGDRGSASVEMALGLGIGLLVLAFVVIAGRVALTSARITGVAGAAARAASLARTAAAADAAAHDSAVAALSAAGLHCITITVTTDTSGFAVPAGQLGTVTVDVACTVDLSDIAAPGLPGTKALRDRAVSPVDSARSRP